MAWGEVHTNPRPSRAELQILIRRELDARWQEIKPADIGELTAAVIEMWQPLLCSVAASIVDRILDTHMGVNV